MSTKEALPKAAFQYGVKMQDGRKTRKHKTEKNEKAELDREWNKIQVGIVLLFYFNKSYRFFFCSLRRILFRSEKLKVAEVVVVAAVVEAMNRIAKLLNIEQIEMVTLICCIILFDRLPEDDIYKIQKICAIT